MSSGDELRIYIVELARALEQNLPPPPIPPDLPVAAESEIDLLLAALGVAGSTGDPADMAAGEARYAERVLQTGEAMTRFPATEEQSAQAMQQVMGMAQQVPQQLSGVSQGFGGVFGGFLQQLNQALQQSVQAGQQLAGEVGGIGEGLGAPGEALGDAVETGGALLGTGGAAGGAAAGIGTTTPTGTLGPPATPSPATFPASSTSMPAPAAGESGAARGAMGGYPMMPPGPTGGAAPAGDIKADTKRIVAPAVKNGAPVQGRITTTAPLPEVTKRLDGKPITTRRVLAPDRTSEENTEPDR